MESFTLALPNGETVAGIKSIPSRSSPQLRYRPLVVGLHGGHYECHYFDADSNNTASISSTAYDVPFVAIDRPCYGGSSSFLPVPEGSNFLQETAVRLNTAILPALWTGFGIPNDCSCIVLLSHSLGVMSSIPAAALHARDTTPRYPLGGIICSGLGDEWRPHMWESRLTEPNFRGDRVTIDLAIKDKVMFLPGTFHPDVLLQTERLHCPAPFAEIEALPNRWLPKWKSEWAAHVKAPVMYALVDQDAFFLSTQKDLDSCVSAFHNSIRVDSSLVYGAPHCMELSFWAQGWYARCFGFALECAASAGVTS